MGIQKRSNKREGRETNMTGLAVCLCYCSVAVIYVNPTFAGLGPSGFKTISLMKSAPQCLLKPPVFIARLPSFNLHK